MLQFKNEALNKAFKIKAETDTVVNLPASRTYKAYSGPLSGIPNAEMLEAMVSRGSNLVSKVQEEKEQTPDPLVPEDPAKLPEVVNDPPPPPNEGGEGERKEEEQIPPSNRKGGKRNK